MPHTRVTSPKKSFGKHSARKFNYILEYSQATSFHGINQIFLPGRHISERLFWIVIVSLAIYGCGLLVESNFIRFRHHPTVISLERDFRGWNTTFPAATICYNDPVDLEVARDFASRKWGAYINDNESMNYYMGFLSAVANSSYMSLQDILPYEHDPLLNEEDLLPLALEVAKDFRGDIFIYSAEESKPVQTLTEVGLCYTMGSMIAEYISPITSPIHRLGNKNDSGLQSADGELEKNMKNGAKKPVECNILNSLCYGRFGIHGGKINYYVHSALEVPIWGSRTFTVEESMQRDTTFLPLATVASDDLGRLRQRQRKCLFMDEGQTNAGLGEDVWKPSFTADIPVCKIAGLACLYRYSDYLKKLESPPHLRNSKSFQCICRPQCNDVTFLLDSNRPSKKSSLKDEAGIRLAVEQFSRVRLRREIIFGIEDLIGSLGGAAGLFLGCSLLSAAELIYFFTLRLWCDTILWKNRRNIGQKQIYKSNNNKKTSLKIKVKEMDTLPSLMKKFKANGNRNFHPTLDPYAMEVSDQYGFYIKTKQRNTREQRKKAKSKPLYFL